MALNQNSLTLEANVITLLLQLKHLVQGQSVGIKEGLRADINSNTLIHCFGCWRKLKGVAGVLSKTCPFSGKRWILCKFLFCFGSLRLTQQAESRETCLEEDFRRKGVGQRDEQVVRVSFLPKRQGFRIRIFITLQCRNLGRV